MTIVETLIGRNEEFAALRYRAGLSMMPTLKTVVVACVDPRVDPAEVLGLRLGEAVVVRNIGGRITPATLQTMAMLGMIGRAEGGPPGSGWNVVVLHHTDCGISRLLGTPDLLADHFGIPQERLEAKAVGDPRAAVVADVATLRETAFLPGEFVVSGLVYDVATGLLGPVVPPAPLRNEGRAG